MWHCTEVVNAMYRSGPDFEFVENHVPKWYVPKWSCTPEVSQSVLVPKCPVTQLSVNPSSGEHSYKNTGTPHFWNRLYDAGFTEKTLGKKSHGDLSSWVQKAKSRLRPLPRHFRPHFELADVHIAWREVLTGGDLQTYKLSLFCAASLRAIKATPAHHPRWDNALLVALQPTDRPSETHVYNSGQANDGSFEAHL